MFAVCEILLKRGNPDKYYVPLVFPRSANGLTEKLMDCVLEGVREGKVFFLVEMAQVVTLGNMGVKLVT